MAQDTDVKKVRRRRKRTGTPEELKSGRSAASVSSLYQSQMNMKLADPPAMPGEETEPISQRSVSGMGPQAGEPGRVSGERAQGRSVYEVKRRPGEQVVPPGQSAPRGQQRPQEAVSSGERPLQQEGQRPQGRPMMQERPMPAGPLPSQNGQRVPMQPPQNGQRVPMQPPQNGQRVPTQPPQNAQRVPMQQPPRPESAGIHEGLGQQGEPARPEKPEAKPPVREALGMEGINTDNERKSALDSISTFSGGAQGEKPEKGGSRKKQEPSGEAQGRDRNENIYLRYEQENTGREENRSRESEAYAQTQADVSERRRRAVIINMVIILAEVIVLGIVLFNLFKYKRLLEESDFSAAGAGMSEEASGDSAEGGSEEAEGGYETIDTPATIDFSNESFALKCTRLQLTKDSDGNPAALLYFTFVNKTETPLSMSEVFPPMVVQDEIMCETFAPLDSPPDEFYNRDTQIANGEGINCAYSVKLQNTDDPVTLTIHDNYETYEDVASTVINLK